MSDFGPYRTTARTLVRERRDGFDPRVTTPTSVHGAIRRIERADEEEREFLNHARFLETLAQRRFPESIDDVAALHAELFEGVLGDAGRFKDCANFIFRKNRMPLKGGSERCHTSYPSPRRNKSVTSTSRPSTAYTARSPPTRMRHRSRLP